MNNWKIVPFAGKDTSGEYILVALQIRFNGLATVEPSSDGIFQVDYYTSQDMIRAANRDIITKETITTQLLNMGIERPMAELQAEEMMKQAILHLIGGTSKEERYATLSQIVGSFGLELLPIEAQDGFLAVNHSNSAPAITPMQEI